MQPQPHPDDHDPAQALAQQLADADAALACVITRTGQGRLVLAEGLTQADGARLLRGFAEGLDAGQARRVGRTEARRRR